MEIKRNIVLMLAGFGLITLTYCKAKKEIDFTNENPTGDSSAVMSVTYDKDGNVTAAYISDELRRSMNNIEGAGKLNVGAHYEFKEENGIRSKVGVFHRSLSTEYFVVGINNDTIKAGEDFKGEITTFYDDFDIEIENQNSYQKTENINAKGIKNIEFLLKPSDLGIKSFKGKLKNKSKEVPFEFFYVVVP